MSKRTMRAYDKEFKLNAVKLYLESGQTYKKVGVILLPFSVRVEEKQRV
jgi:hypothetical protein